MVKFRIKTLQINASGTRRFEVYRKVKRGFFSHWEYYTSRDTLEAAEELVKELVEYPRTIEVQDYYESGNKYYDCGW